MGISSVGVPEEGERIAWIDALKGIGILCVVFGYAWQGVPRIVDYLYSFSFPLFFLVSGFLYDSGKYRDDYRRFLRGRTRTLLLPYLVFAAVSLLCWHTFGTGRESSGAAAPLFRALIGVVLADNYGVWPEINMALWFPPCLFVAENLFFLLERRVRASRLPAALAFLAVAGYAGSLFLPFRVPWGAEIALTGAVLYGMGFLVRRKGLHAALSELSVSRTALGSLFLAGIFIHLLNVRVDMSDNRLGNFFCFYLGALACTAFCALAAFRLKECQPLRFLGKNFLPILGLHLAVTPVAYSILSLPFHTPLTSFKYSLPLGALLGTAQIALILPLILMVRRGIPLHRIRIPVFTIPDLDRTAIFHVQEKRSPERIPALRFSPGTRGGEDMIALRFQPKAIAAQPKRPQYDIRRPDLNVREFKRAAGSGGRGEEAPAHALYPERHRFREVVSSRSE